VVPENFSPARVVTLAAIADALLVLLFVLIGRGSHEERFTLVGALTTWWPFLVGLALGWLVMRAWRRPTGLVLPGIPIWAITVVVGMLLRLVSGQGIQLSFVIVASAVLAVFLLGWRAAAKLVSRIRHRAQDA
jgi:hypothetical protein